MKPSRPPHLYYWHSRTWVVQSSIYILRLFGCFAWLCVDISPTSGAELRLSFLTLISEKIAIRMPSSWTRWYIFNRLLFPPFRQCSVIMGSTTKRTNFLVIMILALATSGGGGGDWDSFTCKLRKEGIQMDFPTAYWRLYQRPYRTQHIIQLWMSRTWEASNHTSWFHICQPAFTD